MSQTIVQCPGCNAKLKFRTKPGRTKIECPRCSQIISLAATSSAQPKPPPEQSVRKSAAPARHSQSADEFAPEGGGSKTILIATMAVLGLGLAGGAGWFLGNMNQQPNANVDTTTSIPAASEAAVAESGNPTDTTESTNRTEETATTSISPPEQPAAVVVLPKLEYNWDNSQEHIYKFDIQADMGNEVRKYDGTCTFFVKDKDAATGVEEEGSGTGFVVDAEGVIATCAHVVEGAEKIEVVINGQSYTGTVLEVLEAEDLALIKIPANNLPVANLGDSDSVELAESVRAVGFPLSDVLGTRAKVATGSVAGLIADPKTGSRIQVDAPINPGNSGGPIVNDYGQVIGVASAKLSGSLVSSVGFAVPINRLKPMMEKHNVEVKESAKGKKLPATTIVKEIIPRVAYIKVWGGAGSDVQNLTFKAACTERAKDGKTVKDTTRDEGKIRVNARGEIVFTTADEHLPFVLGPIASYFFDPIDRNGAGTWQTEYETALHRIKRTEGANNFFGRFGMPPNFGPPVTIPGPGGRMRLPRGPRGPFGSPFAQPEPKEKTIDILPAVERTTYQMNPPVDGKVNIRKTYEFTTTRDKEAPYLHIEGKGDVIFDQQVGLPVSLTYQSTLTHTIDGEQSELPIRVTWHRRDPAEVKQEREDAENERTIPNPELVRQLLTELKDAGKGSAATPLLNRLGTIAVAPEVRADVLSQVKGYRAQNDRNMKGAAEKAFANWADENEFEGLKKIYTNALSPGKSRAYSRLCSFGPEFYPQMVAAMSHQHLQNHAKRELIKIGPDIEDEILKQINDFKTWVPQVAVINVLQEIGTEKSIEPLKAFLSRGVGLKVAAGNAIKHIQARK